MLFRIQQPRVECASQCFVLIDAFEVIKGKPDVRDEEAEQLRFHVVIRCPS